ncbi:hypothetical protein Gbro_4911 (plasmid) [Gordonia bronchialis DSM 43247]|uniref:Secreted protein n=1 Tax=Gordonia bronchialis (strain ATCC 25592 / DSM 43247 / BCRC 13721 / JCM 3198 / KCTC 3076 / NBRC 16047 / NCTC 10667) TaxID=526226 RepID=D0LFH5_GORB4|nr:hypothetical protein Gbro_4911 [Gordonia bronchialis DSM 43247]STS10814.1 Uncharacterised protein [Gordonia bronchialis]
MFSTRLFGRIILAVGIAATLGTTVVAATSSSAHAAEVTRQQCTITGMFIKCGTFPTLQQCETARTYLGGAVNGRPLHCDGARDNWALRALLT